MFPPPLIHPRLWPPSRPLTEVHNRSRRNILRDHVLPPRDVFPDPLEACFHHCLLQWWVFSTTVPPSPQMPPSEPSRDPVLETSKGPLHPWSYHPRLLPEQQHRLRHRFKNISRHLRIRSLPAQYPRQPTPTLP